MSPAQESPSCLCEVWEGREGILEGICGGIWNCLELPSEDLDCEIYCRSLTYWAGDGGQAVGMLVASVWPEGQT